MQLFTEKKVINKNEEIREEIIHSLQKVIIQ